MKAFRSTAAVLALTSGLLAMPAQAQTAEPEQEQPARRLGSVTVTDTVIEDSDMASAAASGVARPISAKGTAMML